MEKLSNSDGAISALPYKLMLSCPSGLLPPQVSVIFDQAYDRIPHPDVNLENSIAQIWNQRTHQNSSLYNGKKFRYCGHALHTSDADNEEDCHAFLHLGLTDYSCGQSVLMIAGVEPSNFNYLHHFLLHATLLKSRTPKQFLERIEVERKKKGIRVIGEKDETIRCQHTSNPLGNGGIVESSDVKIVLLKRSNNVGEFPGYFVFPGGHPEPEEVGIMSHANVDPESLNKRVSLEIFDSIVREVVEEIGVPATSLSKPVFIGISRRELNVRPTAFFFMKCSFQSKDIEKLYGSAQDAFESTQLNIVSKDQLENVAWKMPGCHHGGFALYRLMLEAAKQNCRTDTLFQNS